MATAIQVKPSQVFVAQNHHKYLAFLAHLDARGYTRAGQLAKRIENPAALTVTIEYPTWTMTL